MHSGWCSFHGTSSAGFQELVGISVLLGNVVAGLK